MDKGSFLRAALGSAALVVPAPFMVAAAQVTSAEEAEVGMSDIVVTAQKRSERLLDVPMSIAVATGAELERANIGSTGDLQQVTPGLVTVNNGLAFTPAIRGISSVGSSPGDEPNVSLYVDDVYIGASIAGLFDFKDIERIEVLKGPQGTLFGRNATGGAIRVVTKAPSFTPSADVSVDYGFDFKEWKLGAYLTGPISDKVAASLAGYYLSNDGYVEGVGPVNAGRRYAVSKNWSLRGKLMYQPVDELRIIATADYSDRNDNSVFSLSPVNNQVSVRDTPGVVIPGPWELSSDTQPIQHIISKGVGLDIAWDTDQFTVRSISSYRSAEALMQTDADRTNVPTTGSRFVQGQSNFSQEFNFSKNSDGPLSWLLGLYYYNSNAYLGFSRSYTSPAPTGALRGDSANNVDATSYAIFGEVTYQATDRLTFIGGARYTTETKWFNIWDIFRPAGIRQANDKETWKSPSFRAVAKYELSDTVNVYASYSTGFKSGVYNSYANPVNVVDPEKIAAIEVGAKAKFGPLTATAAVFQYNYDDIQVQAYDVVAGVPIITLTNAARAKVQGFELDLSGPIGDHFDFSLGASALPKAEYTKFTTAQVFIPNAAGGATSTSPYNASGSRLIRAPELQLSAKLTYHTDLFGGAFLTTATYSRNSGFYWQAGNLLKEPAYSLVNLRLAWTEPSDRFTFSVWGQNLTNEKYSIYTAVGSIGVTQALAKPQQIGVGVSAKF